MKYKKISSVVTALALVTGFGGVTGVFGHDVSSNIVNTQNVNAAPTSGDTVTVKDPTGRVTFSITPIYDGTGFGTSSQCRVNSANGYPGGDDNANDGVVCMGDTIGYRIDYSVAPSDKDTVVNFGSQGVTTDLNGNPMENKFNDVGGFLGESLGNFCKGGTGLVHTGTMDNGLCRMVFPASNASSTSSANLEHYTMRDAKSDYNYQVQVQLYDVNKSSSTVQTVNTSKIKVIGAPAVDPMIIRDGDPVYKVINGVGGMYIPWRLVYQNVSDNDLQRKGTYNENRPMVGNFNVDLTNFPEGTQITPPGTPGWSVNNGNLIGNNINFIAAQALGWKSAYDPTWVAGKGATDGKYMNTFSTFTPVSSYDSTKNQTWNAVVTKAEIKDNSGYPQLFSNNFNNLDEPGLNKGKDYNTEKVLGPLTEKGQQGSNNNDWSITEIAAGVLGSGNMIKVTRLDVDGKPDFDNTAPAKVYPVSNTKYWSDIMLKPANIQTSNTALCDAFASSGFNNGQKFDTSRTPIVTWWDEKTKQQVNASYKIYYGHSAIYSNGGQTSDTEFNVSCKDDSPRTTWSTTPDDNTNLIKVVLDGDQDFAVDSDLAGRVVLPFIPFDKDSYPNPNENHTLKNTVGISSGDQGRWAGYSGSQITVGSPNYGWRGDPQNRTMNAGTTIDVNPIAGVLGNPGLIDNNDPKNFETSIIGRIDSCVSSFTVPQSFKDTFDYEITPADFGPDGLPCTDDDVSGWVIRTTGMKKDIPNTQSDSEYIWSFGTAINGGNWSFSVPAYVKGGTQVKATFDTELLNVTDSNPNDNQSTLNITVNAANTVGQSKLTTTPLEQVRNDAKWTLTWFNTSQADQGQGQFIDVLPYNGDNRGSKLSGKLTDVRINNLSGTKGATYYVTTADPKTVVPNVSDASNQPGGSTKWCEYTDKNCIGSNEITAIKVVQDKMLSGYIGGAQVTANTKGNSDNDVLYNNLGVGSVDGFALGIPTTNNVETKLYDTKIGGTVYWDANNNGTLDSNESRRFAGATISIYDDNFDVIKTATSDSNGNWSISGLPLSGYGVVITDRGGNILAKWNMTEGSDDTDDPTSVTLDMGHRNINNINFGFYLKANPSMTIEKSAEGYKNNDDVVTGTNVTWNYVVKNTGDTTINNIKVKDSKGVNVICPKTSLNEGESMTCKGTGPVTAE